MRVSCRAEAPQCSSARCVGRNCEAYSAVRFCSADYAPSVLIRPTALQPYHGAQCRIGAALGEHRVALVMPAGAAAAWSVGAAGMLCWAPADASVLPR